MTFDQAYNYIISFHNLPRKEYMKNSRHCGIYLNRLQFFLDILDNPEKKIPHYIHIAGTSGKGSVTSFLHSILHAAGKKTGSTQSPHPTIITERWKIGNRFMTMREFVKLVEYIKPKLDKYIETTPYDMLSFFELIEAISFLYFAEHRIEWVVLEAGCGGKFDSSNIIPHKDAAVITNIGLDHVGIIGDNKEEIAHEKAGIIMNGGLAFTPEKSKKLVGIIENQSKRRKIPLTKVDDVKFSVIESRPEGSKFNYQDKTYRLSVIGEHQIKNAILCIEIAQRLTIPQKAIERGLKLAEQPLRMEVISKKPTMVVDGAHNIDKIKTTIDSLDQLGATKKGVHLIVGFSHDKTIQKIINQLATLKPISIACTRNTVNPFRKIASPQEVTKRFKRLLPKTKIRTFLDPHDALDWSKEQNQKNSDLILVTGSIFLAGEIKKLSKDFLH